MTVFTVFIKPTTRNTTVDMTMSSIRSTPVEVIIGIQRRRHWWPELKLEIVKKSIDLGSSVSFVARQHGLTSDQQIQRRKTYLEGSLVALGVNQTVVPASEL